MSSSSGFPDWQGIQQWFGDSLASQTALAIGAGSRVEGPFSVNSWASIIIWAKATAQAVTFTVVQTIGSGPAAVQLSQAIVVPAGSTTVQAVVLLGDTVQVTVQGAAVGAIVDYAIVPSNTTQASIVSNVVRVLHNGALVASEAGIDFVDAAGLIWAVADDAGNGKVTVAPSVLSSYLREVATFYQAVDGGGTGVTLNLPGDVFVALSPASVINGVLYRFEMDFMIESAAGGQQVLFGLYDRTGHAGTNADPGALLQQFTVATPASNTLPEPQHISARFAAAATGNRQYDVRYGAAGAGSYFVRGATVQPTYARILGPVL